MTSEIGVYPSQYETEAVLKDGSRILLRPIRRDDTERWLEFVKGLSEHTRYLRFHHVPKQFVMEDAIRYCTVDYINSFAFVAEVIKKKRKQIVAIGRYYRLPDKHSAEIAFVIDDAYQGKGIGTKLVEFMANVAWENKITTFIADALAENEQMMQVFRDYGFHITTDLRAGVYHVTFPIKRTRKVIREEDKRERNAILASLSSILEPRSIAVIGASRDTSSIGHLILYEILQNGYTGVVYPVNPNAEAIMSIKAYPSVLDVPGDVELAVVVVPARFVSKVVEECGNKRVRALVVISDGFKESGPEGEIREKELREITLGHGMRLVGPNCMGVINTDPRTSMNATFSRVFPPRGSIAFLSQSGAMGLVILEYAATFNIGISTFVSVGNRADVSSIDLLQYWGKDPTTKVILLYLESFGSASKFSRIARSVSAVKPILAVKSGTTPAGSRAASSHTGAMATPDIVSDALFRQAGIIRVNSVKDLFDVAYLVANQPAPRGRRLVIITNGGGPGIIAADACSNYGIQVPELSPETKTGLKAAIKRDITLNNPVDLTAGASPEEFENVLKILANDGGYDAVLTIFVPPTVIDPTRMQEAIRRVIPVFQRNEKTLLACFMGQKGIQGTLGARNRFVPSYLFPEDAVAALARAMQYGEIVRRPKGNIPKFRGINRARSRKIVETAMSLKPQQDTWLSPADIAGLLGCYGIRIAEIKVARTAQEAADFASAIGFPVAIKLYSSTITHKTDVGGVKLNIRSKEEVEKAFADIKARLAEVGRDSEMEGVMVQQMVRGGIEAIVGVTHDPTFGPLIMFGLGGIYAELLKDIALRLHPLTDLDARELVSSIKMSKLFEGYRGSAPHDTGALQDLLLRVSALVEDVPEIAEMDLNPVMVMPEGKGYWVVDARILVR